MSLYNITSHLFRERLLTQTQIEKRTTNGTPVRTSEANITSFPHGGARLLRSVVPALSPSRQSSRKTEKAFRTSRHARECSPRSLRDLLAHPARRKPRLSRRKAVGYLDYQPVQMLLYLFTGLLTDYCASTCKLY